MAYLDNSTTIVDAILTKKGRERLAEGRDNFKITQFALGDDEHLMPVVMNQRLSSKYLVSTNSIDNITVGFSKENSKTGDFRASNGVQHQFISHNYEFVTTTHFSASVFNGQKTGFVPAEYQPSHEYSIQQDNLKYSGCKNTINTTTDGKEPIEVFETSPSQLVVSNTGGNTLQVQ